MIDPVGSTLGAGELFLRTFGVLPPQVEFRQPVQQQGLVKDPRSSLWLIPVTIKPGWFFRRRHIERCTAWVMPDTGGTGISMRWQSRDRKDGESQIVLERGVVRLIPVAVRAETEGFAVITNENYLLHREAKWLIQPGSHFVFELQLRSGDRRWTSPHRYMLRVPPADVSNGHFILSQLYPDQH
jgi:hypothetical protein